MAPNNPMNVDEIHKLAESIKTIENFAANSNFDSSLFNISLKSAKPTEKVGKTPTESNFNIMLILSVLTIFVSLGVYLFVELTNKQQTLSLIIAILAVGFATIGAHLKYKNSGATAILAFALIAVISIGYEIFTPKEVIEKAEKMLPGK